MPQSLRHLARPPFYYYSCVLASKPVDVDGPIFTGSNREPLPIVVPSDFGKPQKLSPQHATMWLVFFSMFLWGWLAGDEKRSYASHIIGYVGLAVSFPAIWALQVWYWISCARKRARELANERERIGTRSGQACAPDARIQNAHGASDGRTVCGREEH